MTSAFGGVFAQRQSLRCSSREHPCKPPPYRSVHDPFKTASGVQSSGPWDLWLPVVENSRLSAQRGHSAGTAHGAPPYLKCKTTPRSLRHTAHGNGGGGDRQSCGGFPLWRQWSRRTRTEATSWGRRQGRGGRDVSTILTSCRTHAVQSYTIETISMFFALLLRSANQACTECSPAAGAGGGGHTVWPTWRSYNAPGAATTAGHD